ncbi:MAG TPA: hypothetical protein VF438_01620 [Candidatus Paceibacterota bacterium]
MKSLSIDSVSGAGRSLRKLATRLLFAVALIVTPFCAFAHNVGHQQANTAVIKTDAPPAANADITASSFAILDSGQTATNADNAVTSTLAVCTLNAADATTSVATNLEGGGAPCANKVCAAADNNRCNSPVNTTTIANAPNTTGTHTTAGLTIDQTARIDSTGDSSNFVSTSNAPNNDLLVAIAGDGTHINTGTATNTG